MAKYQTIVGIERKKGEIGDFQKTQYDNIVIHRTQAFDEVRENADPLCMNAGVQTLDPLKIKYTDFEDITGENPGGIVNHPDEYLGKSMIVFFDEKGKLQMLRIVGSDGAVRF